MRKLLVYLRDYKLESTLGPLFKLLEAVFELFVPLVVAAVIDQGIRNSDKGYVLRSCLIIVSLGVVGLVCSITAQYFAAKASAGFAKKVKRALFSHIQSLSHAEIDRLGTSTLITRMTSDMNQVQSGVNLTLRLLLRSPFVVFGAMIMAFTIDVRAALVFAVAIPALSVVVFGIMLWCIPLYRRAQSKLDRVLALTRENLAGVRVLRAFRKERDEVRTFAGENEALTQVQKHVGRISALMNPLTYVILHIAVVALIWVGALRVEAGVLTQGAMVALYSYMTQILVELVKLASLIITITKSIACANRIQEVLEV
ncbi:MAG: ABC transporter permease, partial [Christensenellales bacterium]